MCQTPFSKERELLDLCRTTVDFATTSTICMIKASRDLTRCWMRPASVPASSWVDVVWSVVPVGFGTLTDMSSVVSFRPSFATPSTSSVVSIPGNPSMWADIADWNITDFVVSRRIPYRLQNTVRFVASWRHRSVILLDLSGLTRVLWSRPQTTMNVILTALLTRSLFNIHVFISEKVRDERNNSNTRWFRGKDKDNHTDSGKSGTSAITRTSLPLKNTIMMTTCMKSADASSS